MDKSPTEIMQETKTRIQKEMRHFMKVGQFEPLPDDIWDELPPIVPVYIDYRKYSDYEDYYYENICNSQIEDKEE